MQLTKADLVESASRLRRPTLTASADYARRRDAMAAELIRSLLERPDIDGLIGPGNRERLINNSRNMVNFMGSLFGEFEPVVLAETALWSFGVYRSYGFQDSFWAVSLETAVMVLREQLPAESFASIHPCFDWMIVRQPGFAGLIDAGWPQDPDAQATSILNETAGAGDQTFPSDDARRQKTFLEAHYTLGAGGHSMVT